MAFYMPFNIHKSLHILQVCIQTATVLAGRIFASCPGISSLTLQFSRKTADL